MFTDALLGSHHMADGLECYKYLKFVLDREGITITAFAASFGTSTNHFKDIVIRNIDRDAIPEDPDEQRLMAAVWARLQQARPIPVLTAVER